MIKILLVMTGGALGSVSRYLLSGFTHKYIDGSFPYGTLSVNLLGSFIIGFLWIIFESGNFSSNLRTIMFIGFLGGFTTFSTYALETINLFRDEQYKLAFTNILTNNILALLLVFIGIIAGKQLLYLIK